MGEVGDIVEILGLDGKGFLLATSAVITMGAEFLLFVRVYLLFYEVK